MTLKNKNIVITGGARVGQHVAKELHGAGARLAMTYLTSESEVSEHAKGYKLDVRSEESIRTFVQNVIEDTGTIDGLVNMVSVFKKDSSHITFKEIHEQFSINAFGNMLVSRLFAEHTQEKGAKNAPIISFIDWAIDHPYKNYDVYDASKAALRHYLMALQTTFAGTIRVVNIHPGLILEPPGFPATEKEKIVSNTPTKNTGTPEQAAQLVRTALELDFLADNIYLAGGQQWRHRLIS